MRHTLQGFTMWVNNSDFGYDTEEVTLPMPTPKTAAYLNGGMAGEVNQPFAALEALEATVKMSGHNPDIQKLLGQFPGKVTRFTFRAGVLDEPSGGIVTHVAIIEGSPNFGDRDAWKRGDQSGFQFVINGIVYYRYDAGADPIDEMIPYPPKWIKDGVDQLSELNASLGY